MPSRRKLLFVVCQGMAALVALTVLAEDVPRVTFATKRFGGVQLMTVGIDGSNPVQLTDEADDATQPAWSPDGSKIAYVVGPPPQGKIKIADPDGKNARFLLNEAGAQREPQWSPDGKQLLFTMFEQRNGCFNIFVANADGTGLRNLTDSNKSCGDPAWSPDGSRIAFVSVVSNTPTHLFVMNADGSGQSDVLSRDLSIAVYPTWTPDGRCINFGGPDEKGQLQVRQVHPDGTGEMIITPGPRRHSYASWSPDGRYLAYVADPGSEAGDLCIYDVITGEHRSALFGQVFVQVHRAARPAWIPQNPKANSEK